MSGARPTILITGKSGQLGSELMAIQMSYPGYQFVFLDRTALNLATLEGLRELFEEHRPRYFINAGAYTAVDKAESERETALAVNGQAPAQIAEYCKNYGTTLIHISTDYVFDGKGTRPYRPGHPTAPVNFYGQTKLIGEEAAMSANPATIIIRTAWVFSTYGHNFVKTMLRLMQQRSTISVVNDQIGAPTYARDLAVVIMTIIDKGAQHYGPYHFSNAGKISWYDFAVAIKEKAKLNCEVTAIPTEQFPTPARRPHYSVLDTTSLTRDYGIQPRDWQSALQECLSYMERL